VLRIEIELDWQEERTLLKLRFPTSYNGTLARFGAPFGSTLRGQQPGQPAIDAQWEVPASRWAAVFHDGERDGLMLLAEANYGFSARSGDLAVSLVRSPRITGCDDHRYAAPRGLGRLKLDSPYSDQGRHEIRLAVGRHDLGAQREHQAAALAETVFTTPLVYRGAPRASGLEGLEGGETLISAWAKPLDRGSWLLRLHECGGQAGVARLRLSRGWTVRRCALDGSPLPHEQNASVEPLAFRPYEIVSVRIESPARSKTA
jgi:alpha-mannosidase